MAKSYRLNKPINKPQTDIQLPALDRVTTIEFNALIWEVFDTVNELSRLKGGEYSGDLDRLANFRRNARDCNVPMELIWRIYASKHWDAIMQYEQDLRTAKKRERSESIEGRITDLITYLILFLAMYRERTRPLSQDD